MTEYSWLIIVGLIALGLYLHYLIDKVNDMEDQIEAYQELVLGMARELESLGSPNVKVMLKEDNDEE